MNQRVVKKAIKKMVMLTNAVKRTSCVEVWIGLSLIWARTAGPLRDPEDALADFYEARNRAEDQLMDPLILAGPDVVPVVVEAVADTGMPRRRYAIAFLGLFGHKEAVPILTHVLHDESEIIYFRSDALQALYRIDPSPAESHAAHYSDRDDSLGRTATHIASGSYTPAYDRTWWEALRSVHQ